MISVYNIHHSSQVSLIMNYKYSITCCAFVWHVVKGLDIMISVHNIHHSPEVSKSICSKCYEHTGV